MPHPVRPRLHHPQRIGGISCRAHCHRWCTLKNYHVNNKYKMELINYPTPRRERSAADNGDTDVAVIGVVRNECGQSLSRKDQGGRRQVPDGSARDSVAIALAVAFAAAAVVSCSTAGCRVDASTLPLNAQPRPIEAPSPLVHPPTRRKAPPTPLQRRCAAACAPQMHRRRCPDNAALP
jgi:hypothetical protein